MILPTKHLAAEKALLTIGADVLARLEQPQTVSALWDAVRLGRSEQYGKARIAYGWFILALDLLFMMHAIELERGTIRRTARAS